MLTGWRLTLSKCFLIPQRYVLGLMGFLAVINIYVMRVILSIAITEMVTSKNASTTLISNEEVCPSGDIIVANKTFKVKTENVYDWDEQTQGLILSSFYWGYVFTHLPGGVLAEKFGGKYTVGVGILITAVCTLITPIVVKLGDWPWLIVLRIFVGLGEGTTFPALNAMLAKWVPLTERAKIGCLVYGGAQMGNVIGNGASGMIIAATEDWASVFYVFGAVGVVWFILWCMLCYSSPDTHPFISDEEKKYLQKELTNVSNEPSKIPWTEIFTSAPLWALVMAQLGHDWGLFTMVSDLPKYMKSVLKFNVKDSGIWASLPYIMMWVVSMLSGYLCDWLIKKNYMKITFARKFFTTIASVGPGVFILAASYSGCNRMLTVTMFTIGMGLMGAYYSGTRVNALDLASNYAGTLMAIVNGLGAVSGMITPYLAGALTGDQTLSQWQAVFWITLVVFIVTNIIYVLYGSAEEQWWNVPDSRKGVENENTKKISKIQEIML